ncbi:hypothetical protein [Noviherbaspirillum saxi]|uniref:Uncharacterized protein n=1 Tax=Noviherbaspirillum saxi TaxID=2320863 RepID=A0A3A3FLU7_9BURK|nr:hypothetical protein [Noviherbaspirillum saxi]RJF92502.1 hypothetical protein D3871_28290 [Noviherbaspirillum saxi]
MKKVLTTIAASTLMSLGGLASAAEPVQLSDSQMDSVAAGQTSIATTSGFALIGTVASGADTSTYARYRWGSVTKVTTASSASLASGVFVATTASAGSSF